MKNDKELEKNESKILTKILGPQETADRTWKNRENEELYKYTEKITDTMKKGRLKLYGYLLRLDGNQLTKKIFTYIMGLKVTSKWVHEVKRDAVEVVITPEMIHNGRQFETFEEKSIKRRLNKIISEEERKIRSERIKRFWEEKRRRGRKP